MLIIFRPLEGRSRVHLVSVTLALIVLVGIVDYLTGYEMGCSTFYMIPVVIASWYVGAWFGLVASLLSVLIWLAADAAAGAHYRTPLIPIWNGSIALAFYFVVVWLVCRLCALNRELENRVHQRSAALSAEIVERQRLEKEILAISERERQSIGHDLHDSLGQHLTGTAFAGQVLEEILCSQDIEEAASARQIVDLIEEGIELTHQLARGLHPIELQAEGLADSFRELAALMSERFAVNCQFIGEPAVEVRDTAAATQLYRIAQEALTNAVHHGHAKEIRISLMHADKGIRLSIEDDGLGLPKQLPSSSGLGLRIMAHRANMVGGSFAVARRETGGTIVTCLVPR